MREIHFSRLPSRPTSTAHARRDPGRWFPTADLETLTGANRAGDVGVSRALAGLRNTTVEEAEAAAAAPSLKWYDTPWPIVIALSARLHRHPLPTWFFAGYAPPLEITGPEIQQEVDELAAQLIQQL